MKLRLAQSFCFMLLCSSALTAQTTQAIDVELHNVTLAEALKKLENESILHSLGPAYGSGELSHQICLDFSGICVR